ncbi:HIT family protein [Paenisporosarcina cavernae]|uniref:HIT family protein n=1 Tax=Paenisporosarcina cavernae TaxID=2320858 RepID=A0A385YTQ9_9BACL|nr:HIT family protein [Paenisporosarcina cavernae]AYC30239.1 HIT family protein [Paenisporosarcina cavernae]
MDCLGCKLANKIESANVIFEDDWVTCLLDYDPYEEGHTLILPKQHYRYLDEFNRETAESLHRATTLVSKAIRNLYDPDGITLCQNGGEVDDLTHFHLHVVPRDKLQSFQPFFVENKEENRPSQQDLSTTRDKLVSEIQLLLDHHPQHN